MTKNWGLCFTYLFKDRARDGLSGEAHTVAPGHLACQHAPVCPDCSWRAGGVVISLSSFQCHFWSLQDFLSYSVSLYFDNTVFSLELLFVKKVPDC